MTSIARQSLSESAFPIAAALLAQVSFTAGASLAKTLFPVVGAEGATAIRLALGALILAVLFRPWRIPLRENWKILLAYGTSLAFMNLMFYMALQTIPLGIGLAIEFLGPLSVALFTSRRKTDFLWIGFAVAGLALLLPLREHSASFDLRGGLFALGAGVCWALYILFGQRAGKEYGAAAVAAGMICAAVMVVPVGIAHAGMALFSWQLLPAAIGVGILSSAAPYALEMIALRRLSSNSFGTLMSTEPAIGALVGLALMGEMLGGGQWLGIALVVVASAGVAMNARKPEDAPHIELP